MGIVEILLGVAFPLLVGVGVALTVSDASAAEFWVARICFFVAAVDIVGLSFYWIWSANEPLAWKIVVGLIAGAIIFPATLGAIHWVDLREKSRFSSINKEAADVTLQFVYPTEPALMLINTSNKLAREIKWTVVLWNLDDPRVYSNQNLPNKDIHEPLPIPIQIYDFIRPHSKGGAQNLFSSPLVAPYVKSGDRLIGSASTICPDCERGHTFVVYIEFGKGGWYSEVADNVSGEVLIPKHLTRETVVEYSEKIKDVPGKDRIAIMDPW
jgi:hypothetical protein